MIEPVSLIVAASVSGVSAVVSLVTVLFSRRKLRKLQEDAAQVELIVDGKPLAIEEQESLEKLRRLRKSLVDKVGEVDLQMAATPREEVRYRQKPE